MDLSQAKHAFITGGASGIGLGIADALAKRGIAVTIADINEEALKEVLATRGNQFRGIHLDTRDRDAWQKAKDEAEGAFGPVDILVNNAAVTFFIPVQDFPERRYRLMQEVQVYSPFHLSQIVMPSMRERGAGWIVNVSSGAARHPKPDSGGRGGTVYGMCKAALERFTTGLASEVYQDNIAVNVISPGLVATPGTVFHNLVSGETHERETPVEHMAEACFKLVSEDPKTLTGRIDYAYDMMDEFKLTAQELPLQPLSRPNG